MEWILIILTIILIVLIINPTQNTILFNKPQTQRVSCHQNNQTDLVMLPKPKPIQLTTHITV